LLEIYFHVDSGEVSAVGFCETSAIGTKNELIGKTALETFERCVHVVTS
jgi:hypothetical protein